MKHFKIFLAFVVFLVFYSISQADIPNLINFQGILDSAGNPLANKTKSVEFKIYDALVGGNLKWSETQSVTTNTGGVFNVLLGSSNAIPDSVFKDTLRWLNIKVGTEDLTPRQQIVSNAYGYRVAHFIPGFDTANTFIGRKAGNLTTTGLGRNTAIGESTLTNNTTGYENAASGASALRNNTTGYANTASGWQALYSNTTGSYNVASGWQALYSHTSGNSNTATGAFALLSTTTGIHLTACGTRALQNNTDGGYNTACGVWALQGSTSGNYNTASGWRALYNNTTGSNNTAIGGAADVSTGNLTNATAIGYNAIVNASNKIRLGNGLVTVIEGQVAYTFPSDKNQKENFRPVDGAEVLKKIRGLELSSWNYKGHDPKQFRHYGPMAQDFFAAFGDDGVGKIGMETTLNSGDVAGILMIAVQALGNENAELRGRMEYLEEKLEQLSREE